MKKRILVIEDEPDLGSVLEQILEAEGYEIKLASNGKEALVFMLESSKFDLVISDIGMPVMNGIEFIKSIRKMGCKHPVVFLTAYGKDEYMKEALHYAAFDFISKPFDLSYLLSTIERALGAGRNLCKKDFSSLREHDFHESFLKSYQKFMEDLPEDQPKLGSKD